MVSIQEGFAIHLLILILFYFLGIEEDQIDIVYDNCYHIDVTYQNEGRVTFNLVQFMIDCDKHCHCDELDHLIPIDNNPHGTSQ